VSVEVEERTMESRSRGAALPQSSGRPVVTDGGLETDLIYHYDVELPEFAASSRS
jgi:hypothetical protein